MVFLNDYVLYIQSQALNEDLYEPNETSLTAKLINTGETKEISLHNRADIDHFYFNGVAGKSYSIKTLSREDTNSWYFTTRYPEIPSLKLYPTDMSSPYVAYDRQGYQRQCETSGVYYIKTDNHALGTYIISLDEIVIPPDSFESDNSSGQASPISIGESQSHTIDNSNDVDWCRFDAQSGDAYRFDISLGTYVLDVNTNGMILKKTIYDTDGVSVLQSDNTANLMQWTAPATGTYYISLQNDGMQEVGDYSLTFGLQ